MRHRGVWVFLAVLAGFGAAQGATFVEHPAEEVRPGEGIVDVSGRDTEALTFGLPDGQVAVVGLEDFRVWSRHSSNGGGTFGPEAMVDGAAFPILDIDARLSADGRIYLAMIGAVPPQGTTVRFARSDDMGQTWTTPLAFTDHGDPGHGADEVRIATGTAGHAAVIWSADGQRDVWVSATAGSGGTWTTPVRIDDLNPPRSHRVQGIAIALTGLNEIHAVFTEVVHGADSRATGRRSTDGGLTFEPDRMFCSGGCVNPDIAVAQNEVLVTLFRPAFEDEVVVYRYTPVWWGESLVDDAGADDFSNCVPRLSVDPATSTVFVHIIDETNVLRVWRSPDSGLSWSGPQTLATSGAGGNPNRRPPGDVRMVRTAPNHWVVAWSDLRADAFARSRTDVFARASTDDGASWGTEQLVSTGKTAGTSASWLTGMTAHGADSVFVVFRDGRDHVDRTADIWGNGSTVLPSLAFGPDRRIDEDDGSLAPLRMAEPTVVSDGAGRLYYAFSAVTTGSFSDVWLTVSQDGGRSFSSPVRVGSTPPGERFHRNPVLQAFPDGRVYLLYQSDGPPGTTRELLFNRSLDFGATWEPSDLVLGSYTHPGGFSSVAGEFDDIQVVQRLAATAAGAVYVVWTNPDGELLLRRSTDFGATFSVPIGLDGAPTSHAAFPFVCADGDQVLVTYAAADPETFSHFDLYGRVSEDLGLTFAPRVNLSHPFEDTQLFFNDLACGPAGTESAVLVWGDDRTPPGAMFSNRFDGTSWTGEVQMTTPVGYCHTPDVEFVSETVAVVGYECQTAGVVFTKNSTVHVNRSTDGGETFPTRTDIDDASPDPGGFSRDVRVAAAGAGHVWVTFLDRNEGAETLVARLSTDAGATFGPPRRMNRDDPEGGRANVRAGEGRTRVGHGFPVGRDVAAGNGVAWTAWLGQRDGSAYTALLSVWDVNDVDADGAPSGSDCDDSDPGVRAAPGEVTGVALEKLPDANPGTTRLFWTSLDPIAGPATAYDVIRGNLSDLRASGDFSGAFCFLNDLTDGPADDSEIPGVGGGYYYVVRAWNNCGVGTWGASRVVTACP